MAFLTLGDGDKLCYDVSGQGPPLALVSGLGGTMAFWQPHVQVLARRFRVILHDHRGTGQSSRRPIDFSVEQMAGDLIALLDHLDVRRAHLIGHSTGGAIGQTVALDHARRLDRLVLSASWTSPDEYFRRLFALRADTLRNLGPLAYAQGTSLFGLPAAFLRDHAAMLTIEEAASAMAMSPDLTLARIGAILRFDRRGELGRIAAPTLVFGARDDLITPAYFSEALAEAIPGARLVMLDEGGHFYPRVHPARFQETVLEFLNDT